MVTSEQFGTSNITVTLQWSGISGETYNVSVTPIEPELTVIQDTSALLTVSYNTEYNINIMATNCVGMSTSSIRLFYGKVAWYLFYT